MSARRIIGKMSAVAAVVTVLTALVAVPVAAWDTVFEIRAKDGTAIVGETTHRLAGAMDPENTVRMGFELRPGMMIGFNSKYGFGLVMEF
jgi:hypothetical protein